MLWQAFAKVDWATSLLIFIANLISTTVAALLAGATADGFEVADGGSHRYPCRQQEK